MKNKKLIALLLVTVVAVNVITPAFAEEGTAGSTTDTAYTVQYSQVEQMVLGNNLQAQSNALAIGMMSNENKTKEQYQQLANVIQQTSTTLTAIMNSPTATQDMKTVAQGTNVSLSSLLSMFQAQGETSDDDYELTELQMNQGNYQMVKAAQSMFSVYYQLQYNLEQMSNTRVTLEDTVKAAQTQYNLGLCTSVAVADANASVTTLDNNIADLKNQSKSIGYQMNQLLGHAYNDQITFGKMPEPDTGYAGKINLKNDFAEASAASYTVQIDLKQRTIIGDETRTNRDQRQMKSNAAEMEIQKIGASLETQYAAIQKQQSVLALEQKNLDSAKLKRDQAQTQYNIGTLSLINLNTAKNNYLKQQTVVETAKSTLFWNIETYRWIVKGLPAS